MVNWVCNNILLRNIFFLQVHGHAEEKIRITLYMKDQTQNSLSMENVWQLIPLRLKNFFLSFSLSSHKKIELAALGFLVTSWWHIPLRTCTILIFKAVTFPSIFLWVWNKIFWVFTEVALFSDIHGSRRRKSYRTTSLSSWTASYRRQMWVSNPTSFVTKLENSKHAEKWSHCQHHLLNNFFLCPKHKKTKVSNHPI